MRAEVLTLILIAGAFNWGFRYLPTRLDLTKLPQDGAVARFLASTGPAAIATLFVAAVLPIIQTAIPLPALVGAGVVLATYAATRSVVGATLAGSAAYGAMFALMMP